MVGYRLLSQSNLIPHVQYIDGLGAFFALQTSFMINRRNILSLTPTKYSSYDKQHPPDRPPPHDYEKLLDLGLIEPGDVVGGRIPYYRN